MPYYWAWQKFARFKVKMWPNTALQPLDTFPWLLIHQKCVYGRSSATNAFFGVFRSQGTCLMAANVILPRWGELQSSTKSLSWIWSPLRGGDKQRRKETQGKEKEGKGREKTPPPRNKVLFAVLSIYLVLHVVGGQFTEHVVSQAIHNTLSRLTAAAARVFRLNTDNGCQHLVHHVRLITATQSHIYTKWHSSPVVKV